jgi:hypothetical protein
MDVPMASEHHHIVKLRPTFYYNACDVNSLTYELDDAGHQWALYLTEAKPMFLFT